jgi:glycosyltransferase involved in cell wall biosynthesis/GT2 family glycosyltransferase
MSLSVAVLDMQPIDPPIGGGRLRLLGLYHDLGHDVGPGDGGPVQALYVGTYDWPGPGGREQCLGPSLTERMVPLSAAHFAAAEALARQAGGRTVIDSAFHTQAHLSPDYLAAARAAAAAADVVICSHPWLWPLVRGQVDRSRQLVIYDSHNVEGLLRIGLLDDGGTGSEIARGVVAAEYAMCREAHLILACSQADREDFVRFYGVPAARTRVVANGTFTRRILPADAAARAAARAGLGIPAEDRERKIAFFLGSGYGPNTEAGRFIAATLAPALPEVRFVLAGGVCDSLEGVRLPPNLRLAGLISEDEKLAWLRAADIAINPMFSGSGTNIKMLDFMAAGLPILTTPTGARGIETSAPAFRVAGAGRFADALDELLGDADAAATLGANARTQADRFYSWERLSAMCGRLFARHHRALGRRPFFTVVVPTYERPERLTRLVERIAAQSERDFELIVVDQSAKPWPDRDRDFGIDLYYVHSEVRGAVTARNIGGHLAAGRVIAFTDDDCEPTEHWLAAARAAFEARPIVGVEGLITSARMNDPEWRAVTNDGFEGVGFMTANLFVRAGAFQAIGGFDIAFENPHFREDTDLGWRLQAIGEVPFSREAAVFHPPHPRSVERESLEARSRFFEKDALLLRKHPARYVDLFLREAQWVSNPHFWPNFLRGMRSYGVELPAEIREHVPRLPE